MRFGYLKLLLLTALIVLTATWAGAATVTVTPSTMATYGWSVATANGGTGTFTVGGPVASECQAATNWPAGRGGFYATCKEYDSQTPSSVWLGIDKLYVSPGVFKSLELIRLNQIQLIEYKTYVPTIPSIFNKIPELHYPRQPVHVAIATAKNQPPGYLNRRWYVSMPWPYSIGVYGNQNDRFGHWDDIFAVPELGSNAGWYCSYLEAVAPYYGKWDTFNQLITDGTIGSQLLVPTSTYWDPTPLSPAPGKDPRGWMSAGYDETTTPQGAMASTGTGKAINFYVGARAIQADLSCWYNEPYTAWWRESYGFKGCLDEVTIGVDFGTDGGYVETTYDFEPEPTAPDLRTVAMTGKSAVLPTGTGAWKLNPYMLASQINKLGTRVKMFGKVIAYSHTTDFGDYIDLDDGSMPLTSPYDPPYPTNPEDPTKEALPQGYNLWFRPLPVRIHIPYVPPGQPTPAVGEYWSAIGQPVVLSWDNPVPGGSVTEVAGQLYLYSAYPNMAKYNP